MKEVLDWAFSRVPREASRLNEAERLHTTMSTTATNRYNASNRLRMQGKFTFFTATVLSLCLIFIPLMQLADAQLALPDKLLNAIQIFLAVAILVYSVVIGTARYDLRSEQLNECGDNIKSLIRELRRENEKASGRIDDKVLAELQRRYSSITTDVENHTRNDYRLTTLQLRELFKITGFVRLGMRGMYWIVFIAQFSPSLMLLAIVVGFMFEVFGITTGLTHLLGISAVRRE